MHRTEHAKSWSWVRSFAIAALVASGCASDGNDRPGVGTTTSTAVLTTTDTFFTTGRLATVSLVPPYAVGENLEELGPDPIVRVFDGLVDVVNRSVGFNIQVIDPALDFATTAQHSTGDGSNPQDVVVRGTTAFVPRYEAGSAEEPYSDVLVMSLTDGATLGRVDMQPYADTGADPGMLPRPAAALEIDGLVWVMLQQIDPTYSAFGEGCFVLVDPATLTVVDTVLLGIPNPLATHVLGDDLYVASAGVFSIPPTLTGGIVKVDTGSRTATLLVDDDDLGSNVSDVAVVSESKGYLVVANVDDEGTPAGTNDVRSFDPRTGAVGDTVFTCGGYLPDIAWNGGTTLVATCRADATPGVVLIDTVTDQVVAGPLDTGLPPFSIAFLP